MQEPYWWYVLFVKANSEKSVVNDISNFAIANKIQCEFEAFVPESEHYFRSKKNREIGKQYAKRPLFPGYVFIETNLPSQEFIEKFAQYIYNSEDVIKLLRYGNSDQIALSEEERQRFEYLFKGKRYLEHSQGYIEGDKVIVTFGPLVGHEGSIKHINRHNRIAIIEFEMFGKSMTVKVALEIIKRIP